MKWKLWCQIANVLQLRNIVVQSHSCFLREKWSRQHCLICNGECFERWCRTGRYLSLVRIFFLLCYSAFLHMKKCTPFTCTSTVKWYPPLRVSACHWLARPWTCQSNMWRTSSASNYLILAKLSSLLSNVHKSCGKVTKQKMLQKCTTLCRSTCADALPPWPSLLRRKVVRRYSLAAKALDC